MILFRIHTNFGLTVTALTLPSPLATHPESAVISHSKWMQIKLVTRNPCTFFHMNFPSRVDEGSFQILMVFCSLNTTRGESEVFLMEPQSFQGDIDNRKCCDNSCGFMTHQLFVLLAFSCLMVAVLFAWTVQKNWMVEFDFLIPRNSYLLWPRIRIFLAFHLDKRTLKKGLEQRWTS